MGVRQTDLDALRRGALRTRWFLDSPTARAMLCDELVRTPVITVVASAFTVMGSDRAAFADPAPLAPTAVAMPTGSATAQPSGFRDPGLISLGIGTSVIGLGTMLGGAAVASFDTCAHWCGSDNVATALIASSVAALIAGPVLIYVGALSPSPDDRSPPTVYYSLDVGPTGERFAVHF